MMDPTALAGNQRLALIREHIELLAPSGDRPCKVQSSSAMVLALRLSPLWTYGGYGFTDDGLSKQNSYLC
jgi:hypothetical protein